MKEVMRIVGLHLDENCCVVSDVGDGLFGALGIRTARRAEFIAPAYYLSMGFAVARGHRGRMCRAIPPPDRPRRRRRVPDDRHRNLHRRATCLRPIILILNNDGYGTMRKIRDGSSSTSFSQWNYGKICELVGGGEANVASTKGELDGALRSALGSTALRVIDVRIPRDDMSPQLANMSAELARLRAANAK
jgi:indolepyruvate decarboxylase